MNGKGSKQRPCLVPRKDYEENWERVFGEREESQKARLEEAIRNDLEVRIMPSELSGPPGYYFGLTDEKALNETQGDKE